MMRQDILKAHPLQAVLYRLLYGLLLPSHSICYLPSIFSNIYPASQLWPQLPDARDVTLRRYQARRPTRWILFLPLSKFKTQHYSILRISYTQEHTEC